jgi:DNA helicase-2/ATP-dependent DNA helicase PcrA
MRSAEQFPILSKRAAPLLKFAAVMDEIEGLADTLPLDELFDAVLEKTGYMTMLEMQGDEGETRIENVRELRSNIVEYMKESDEPTLEGFLEENALYTEADRESDEECVSLMTMHAAKGLEFDTVFVVGMEQGIFPGIRSMDSAEDMEEERRLAYVTITRAKRRLYLLHSQSRMLFGRPVQNPLSRFVREIPEELLECEDDTVRTESAQEEPTGRTGISGMRRQMEAIQRRNAGKSAQMGTEFSVGERICSQVFGEGTVLNVEYMGGDALLEIAFDRVGTKKIMAKYQKLTKL